MRKGSIMDQDERDDSQLAEALRHASPSAPFEREALRDRIERSTLAGGAVAVALRIGPRRLVLRWTARAAAAAALFLGGTWYGRSLAPAAVNRPSGVSTQAAAVPPDQVPLSIQSAGTGYVASLALLSEMHDRLSPEQRDQARQVALAVLSGAIAELVATEDPQAPARMLRTLLSYGIPTGGPGDPVVRYR
jgi:hypothetical protein